MTSSGARQQVQAHRHILDRPQGKIALWDTGGAGRPIVMLHGTNASKAAFSKQFEGPLARSHRLVAIDLPGHGDSENARQPELDYTLPAMATLLAEIIHDLDLDPCVLFGWSMGGHIAIEMMSSHPDLFSGVMISGAPPLGRGALAWLWAFHANLGLLLPSKLRYSRADAERYERLCFGPQAQGTFIETILDTDPRLRPLLTRSLLNGPSAEQKHVVETSAVPLAVVNGADEPIVRLSYFAGLDFANLWEGRVHAIAGAGHAPFYNQPQAFDAMLERFASSAAVRERDSTPRHVARRA